MASNSVGNLNERKNAERKIISSFLKFYLDQLQVSWEPNSILYPEDDKNCPDNARIDTHYTSTNYSILVEHTSFDLIATGNTRNRNLDPAFNILAKELDKIECPERQGVLIMLPMEYAKDIPNIKQISPLVAQEVRRYLTITDPNEWEIYPRPSDELTVNEYVFPICPDVLKSSKAILAWIGSDIKFLEGSLLDDQIEKALKNKLPKLKRYSHLVHGSTLKILLIESHDVAAPTFYSSCGNFVRALVNNKEQPDEVWGIKGNTKPILIWSKELDFNITHCVYLDDMHKRTVANIQSSRMLSWALYRKQQMEMHG